MKRGRNIENRGQLSKSPLTKIRSCFLSDNFTLRENMTHNQGRQILMNDGGRHTKCVGCVEVRNPTNMTA